LRGDGGALGVETVVGGADHVVGEAFELLAGLVGEGVVEAGAEVAEHR
jgi:hypothetical protein